MNSNLIKSDTIGIVASTLCMIHCISTPFIFIAKTCAATCCSDSPAWWAWIDVLFLVISFFAIYHTSKNSSKVWVKHAMWFSWSLLLVIIANEQLGLITLFEGAIYVPAISLVVLHFYNLKYCRCAKESCCTNQT